MKNIKRDRFLRAINKRPEWEKALRNDYEKDILKRWLDGETYVSIGLIYNRCGSAISARIMGRKGSIYKRVLAIKIVENLA